MLEDVSENGLVFAEDGQCFDECQSLLLLSQESHVDGVGIVCHQLPSVLVYPEVLGKQPEKRLGNHQAVFTLGKKVQLKSSGRGR